MDGVCLFVFVFVFFLFFQFLNISLLRIQICALFRNNNKEAGSDMSDISIFSLRFGATLRSSEYCNSKIQRAAQDLRGLLPLSMYSVPDPEMKIDSGKHVPSSSSSSSSSSSTPSSNVSRSDDKQVIMVRISDVNVELHQRFCIYLLGSMINYFVCLLVCLLICLFFLGGGFFRLSSGVDISNVSFPDLYWRREGVPCAKWGVSERTEGAI